MQIFAINKLKAREHCLQILKQKIFIRRKLKMEVEKGKKLLEIILTSTFVLTEFMKKNEEEEKGDMGQR